MTQGWWALLAFTVGVAGTAAALSPTLSLREVIRRAGEAWLLLALICIFGSLPFALVTFAVDDLSDPNPLVVVGVFVYWLGVTFGAARYFSQRAD
jgi:hypothetical protein